MKRTASDSIMGEELVSIIMPVFNSEQWLEKSIGSVLEQTYKNIELILVDDGSTDNSTAICKRYADYDPKVSFIRQSNAGQGAARNKALDYCNGSLIAFIDADDCMGPTQIEVLEKMLKEWSLDIATCAYQEVTSQTTMVSKKALAKPNVRILSGNDALTEMWYDGDIAIAPWAKLYRRELWDDVRFKECYAEDLATMHEIFREDIKVGFTSEILYKYVIRHGSSDWAFSSEKEIVLNIAQNNLEYARKFRPSLIAPGRCKLVSVCFHVYRLLPNQYPGKDMIVNQLKNIVKKHRSAVIHDKRSRFKVRLASIISYISFDLVISLIKTYQYLFSTVRI